jgi:hypothetical protein
LGRATTGRRTAESELAAVERFLHDLRAKADPVLRALLDAPLDDEPETKDKRRAVHEARRSWREVRCERWQRCGARGACELDGRPHRQRVTGCHPGPSLLVTSESWSDSHPGESNGFTHGTFLQKLLAL